MVFVDQVFKYVANIYYTENISYCQEAVKNQTSSIHINLQYWAKMKTIWNVRSISGKPLIIDMIEINYTIALLYFVKNI